MCSLLSLKQIYLYLAFMLKFLSIFLTIAVCLSANAQTKVSFSIEKAGVFDPRQPSEDWFVSIQRTKAFAPDGNDWKAELSRLKAIQKERYPAKNNASDNQTIRSGELPEQTKGFQGNLSGSSTPNDNSLAISNDGYLISAINSTLWFYDTNADTLMRNVTLYHFMQPLNLSGSKYDPKVIYDNEADRFILVYLNGTSSNNSATVTCFSTSGNPMDPWNIYVIPGNPLNDTSWTDYPAISINKNDFFLTGNLLISGMGVTWQLSFKQTLIWQVDKMSGYNGDAALNFTMWKDIEYGGRRIRNLHPVRSGRGVHDTDQYFISNRNFSLGTDSIFLVRISDSQLSGNAQISVEHLTSNKQYHLVVDAPQADGQWLATNDCRVLGAIKEQEIIHFVGNTTDTLSGNSAVYHGRIDLTDRSCTGHIVADSVLNFGYPNIAYTGVEHGEEECVIVVEYTSPVHNPGVGAFYFDTLGTYHPLVVLRTGDSTINMLSDQLERWGDYSGIQRKYNEPCHVWMSATYGTSLRKNATWISRVQVADTCRALPVPPPPPSDTVIYQGPFTGVIFPNPAKDMFQFAFTIDQDEQTEISLYDAGGRRVKDLLRDELRAGEYLFSFYTGYLASGIYILEVKTLSGRKFTGKVLIE